MREAERHLCGEVLDLLDFIGLADYAEMAAGELSINVNKLLDTVFALKARYGLTVILVEHVMKLVMASCDVITVLDHGETIAKGVPPGAIRDDHRVIEAYLGKEMNDAEVRALLKAR